MNIGFDLDKVFIDYPPLVPTSIIDKLYKKSSDGNLTYRIPSKAEQLFRLITHFSFFRPPIKENLLFLKNLPKKNRSKYLISSRFAFLKKKTDLIVKKYQFEKLFDGMFFNYGNKQPHLFKDAVIKKIKINKYVDDDLALLKYLSKKNPGCVFFWLNDKIKKKMSRNLFAVTKLSDIL